IRGINQAARNANDGISLAQTAEGALGEVSNNLQRIRELAVQSRNATNSADDRLALQKEVTQLKSEIDRVANQTSFNGTKLLDGSFTSQAFQVGANQGQTITVEGIADANVAALGSWTSVTTQGFTAQRVVNVGAITASVSDGDNVDGDGNGATGVDLGPGSFTLNGETISFRRLGEQSSDTVLKAQRLEDIAAAINANSNLAAAGITASYDGSTPGSETLTIDSGSASTADITISGANTAETGLANVTTADAPGTVPGTAQTGFANLDISTINGADNAILAMDAALNSVNGARADLGAMQNRFSSVVSNLNTTSENLTASRSRIRDADYAKETAELARTQILSQAGTAMLAQANQATQGVLSLLR
ncbi:flagellin, partial [Cognatilysobacter bugurensis]|uniref:flagellin N-terminal helical domain-containing protein n=1 Tax=Cognatilysobacter bugurensis TaxID=543356 RepID=UPI001678E8CE